MYSRAYILGAGIVTQSGVANSNDNTTIDKLSLNGLRVREDEMHIKKKRDYNNMSESQKMMVVSAGEAIASFLKPDNHEIINDSGIFVACSIGERDDGVDLKVKSASCEGNVEGINLELARSKPTQLLMELPNLFSANISIILGLCGESATFIGENSASVNAFNYALEGLTSKNSYSSCLVGGVFNGGRNILKEALENSTNTLSPFEGLGTVASSVFLTNRDDEKGNAVASVDYHGVWDEEQIKMQVANANPNVVCLADELGSKKTLNIEDMSELVEVINITKEFGYLAEATLPFQISFCIMYAKQLALKEGLSALIICQIVGDNYAAYTINVA